MKKAIQNIRNERMLHAILRLVTIRIFFVCIAAGIFFLFPDAYCQISEHETDLARFVTNTWQGESTDWFAGANWSEGVPASDHDVMIPAGVANYPEITSSAVCRDLNIENGASLTIAGTNTLTVSGNWNNNGTFTANSGTVTFNGINETQTIEGSSTTTFFILNLDLESQQRILEAKALIEFSAAADPLHIESGVFKLSSESTITPFTSNSGAVIPENGGIWNNGGTINPGNFSWSNYGLIRNTGGTTSIGAGSGNSLKYYTGSSFIIEGGELIIAGRFYPNSTTQSTDFNMSGGVLRISDIGYSSSTWAGFDITDESSSFSMSGGIIIINNPNGTTGTQRDYRNEAGTINVSGGTVQFGTTVTTGPVNYIVGDGATSSLPDVVLVKSTESTSLNLNAPVHIIGNLILNTGTNLNTNNNNIVITGDWTNNGEEYIASDNSIAFNGSQDQVITGDNTFYDFVVDKTAGNIFLLDDVTITNVLTFKSTNYGNVITGEHVLAVNSAASAAISRQGNGHIVGYLQRAIAEATNSYLFPLGNDAAYAPVEIDFNSETIAGELIGSTTAVDHSQISGSILNQDASVNRYWSFNALSGLETINCDVTLYWTNDDMDVGFDASQPVVGKFDESTWYYPATGSHSTNSVVIPGIISFSDFQVANSLTATISGYVAYYNDENTALENVELELQQSGSMIGSTLTNEYGYYEFDNIYPGDYEVVMNYNEDGASINSTDAAQANYWSVFNESIQVVRFLAGDVNVDHSVNSSDASLIQQYFLTFGNPGPAFIHGWAFWNESDAINGNPGPETGPVISVSTGETSVSRNFYGMFRGDFNGSYIPGNKTVDSQSLTLKYANDIEIGAESFNIALYSGQDMLMGALSLVLNVPADQLNIEKVFLANNPQVSLMYSVKDDKLLVSWYSLNPVSFVTGDPVLILQGKWNENIDNKAIYITLDDGPNELADGNYCTIENARLMVDVFHPAVMSLHQPTSSYAMDFNASPNPFRRTVVFTYSMPFYGQVSLEISDVMGNKIKTLFSEWQTAGNRQFTFNDDDLPQGVYMAILRIRTTETALNRVLKIVNRH